MVLGGAAPSSYLFSKMKLTILGSFAALLATAATAPTAADFSLVGFAKDNPIGPTTGGKGGKTITVTDAAALAAAVQGDTPLTILVSGTFNLTARLKVGSNKSLIGAKKGANILHSGITIANASNVIVRNLGIRFVLDNDGITIQNSTRVWIDHNEFESDINHGPDYYDGQCDIVRASDWITVSWNYFHDHWKSSLVGNSDAIRDVDTGHLHITYQYVQAIQTLSHLAFSIFFIHKLTPSLATTTGATRVLVAPPVASATSTSSTTSTRIISTRPSTAAATTRFSSRATCSAAIPPKLCRHTVSSFRRIARTRVPTATLRLMDLRTWVRVSAAFFLSPLSDDHANVRFQKTTGAQHPSTSPK